jgi:uncharacterized protein (TIGR00255 family)
MPHSMTGFAAAEAAVGNFRLTWELRSVNHRFLDIGMRMPDELRSLEGRCRDALGAAFRRGKVDCHLRLGAGEQSVPALRLRHERLLELQALAAEVERLFDGVRPLSVADVLRWPGIVLEANHEPGALDEAAMRCLADAILELQAARRREGERIAEFLQSRNRAILDIVAQVRPRLHGVQERQRTRLAERVARLGIEADPDRLEQEIVLIAQRLDVEEEIDRLGGHVAEVARVLAEEEPVGRRLDFLIQELNREANTVASKAQDEELTRAAVNLKVLIEQMREQVQNLE